MIRKLLSIFILSSLFIGPTIHADDSENIPVELKDKPRRPLQRPKAPSAQRITSSISNGVLYIAFSINEGDALMTISSQEEIKEYAFDTSAPAVINIGEQHDFQIFVITSIGNCYETDIIPLSIL